MRFALLLSLLFATACRGPVYRAPVYSDAERTYRAILADQNRVPPEDRALWQCELGLAALETGKEQVAFDALHAASKTMGTLESDSHEEARAIFGAEATKTWKGDPHERSMNCLYKGLLYWRRGDLGNASACFKRGLLADAHSNLGRHQRDFAALSFLLGWVSELRGKPEQARYNFKEAARANRKNPYFKEVDPRDFNILAVVDIGRGPMKFADGRHGHLARFSPRNYRDGGVAVFIDGQRVGFSYPATDIYYQATTRGKQTLDDVRKGKAVAKSATKTAGIASLGAGWVRNRPELMAIGLGLMMISDLIQAKADTRHWSMLPAQIHVLPIRVDPGPHTVRVQALDRSGKPIRGWEQSFPVTVDPTDSLWWFRTGRRDDVHALCDPPAKATSRHRNQTVHAP
ncbi:MAG: COG3014 family protein [Planctomycetota bacterium]|jgi:tetratricopeptide (TPR) repeat protein